MENVKFEDREFFKSSLSNYKWVKACVQVAMRDGAIGVRDSKDAARTTLRFTPREWQAFIDGVKSGEFDLKQ